MPENGTYNAMYNPKLEEYLLSNPADVLPEFLVQYKYVSKERGSTPQGGPGRGPHQDGCIINTDLTVPVAPQNAIVGVPRAEFIAAANSVPQPSSVKELVQGVSAPLVPNDHGRPLSSRSRARLIGWVDVGAVAHGWLFLTHVWCSGAPQQTS